MFAWFKKKTNATEVTEIDIFDAPPVILGSPINATAAHMDKQQSCAARAEAVILAARSVA